MRVNGDVAQERVVFVTAEALCENAGPPRGVDDDPTRAVRSMPSGSAKRSATASASKAHREGGAPPHRDSAPLGMAQEDLVESFPEDLERLGVGVSTAASKSAYCSVMLSGGRKVAPHFLTKPAEAIAWSAPRAWKTSLLHGSCDSPMWKRGNRSRSSRRTRFPRRASAVAALEPPGPPPRQLRRNPTRCSSCL